jgi:Ca-activated chloride channel family protein
MELHTSIIRAGVMRGWVALFFLMGLAALACPQTDPPAAPFQVEPYKISVSVDSVVLVATVLNHKGAPVSGLGKEDFEVYEDGALQQITFYSHEDIPVTVGLVVDNSGSMRLKRAEVNAAALAFVRSSNALDQMFVVHFNEHVSFGLPAAMPFTDQPGQLQAALSKVKADGQTALYDAVGAALEHLKQGDRDKKVLIVASDGGDNSSKLTLDQVLAMARKSDAIIYTIDIYDEDDQERNPTALKRLSKATGGETFRVEALPEVVPICERIARDIRSQYTLAYTSTNRAQDGKYRAIQVKGRGPGRLAVRTREGYYAYPKPLPALVGSQTHHP